MDSNHAWFNYKIDKANLGLVVNETINNQKPGIFWTKVVPGMLWIRQRKHTMHLKFLIYSISYIIRYENKVKTMVGRLGVAAT